jgi:hypothetical protein
LSVADVSSVADRQGARSIRVPFAALGHVMRRISVFEVEGQWSFAPGTLLRTEWPSMLESANAAVVYGNTLRGTNAGYVIRLVLTSPEPTYQEVW